MQVRDARADEVDLLARLWHEAWHDAHAKILPVELARIRTFENFRERLGDALPRVRVASASDSGDGPAMGLCIVNENELHQLFVKADARGTGVAAALMADAEMRMGADGFDVAWLTCAIGNTRAERFYQKCDWRNRGKVVSRLPVPDGFFEIYSNRFEKRLGT